MKKQNSSSCADCAIPLREKACMILQGTGAKGCPTLTGKRLTEKVLREYKKTENNEFARQASIQEGSCSAGREKRPYTMHPTKPRILEICELARNLGYTRLGLIFCAGLAKEASVVDQILKEKGFEVISVICKVGSVPKEEIGLKDSEKIFIGEHESMCNPILQAMIINEARTDFNILLGLCVGHDSLFFRYAEAPTTVLAVKDRVTGHSPLASIYLSGNYYAWMKE
jgi:uncharacterized metal-binding protein